MNIPHSPVQTALLQERGMGPFFNNGPPIQHQDLIKTIEPDQPVGDHQGGASLHHFPQRLKHGLLIQWIKVGGRFIEDYQLEISSSKARAMANR